MIEIWTIVAEASATFAVILIAFYRVGRFIRSDQQKQSEIINSGIRRLDAKANTLNGALMDFCQGIPYPAWFKIAEVDPNTGRTEFVMQFINPAYEKFFKKTSEEYVGRNDFQVWPKSIAESSFRNDAATLASGSHMTIQEQIPIDPDDPTGPTQMMEFEKWPIERDGKKGVAGFMRPVNHNPFNGTGE